MAVPGEGRGRRPDGADAVAQLRGSEDWAQGRDAGGEEEAGDESVVAEVWSIGISA